MNEQIKSLALECYNPYGNFDLNKFAELIVRECADVAARAQDENMNWDISGIIKERFGVQ